MFPISTYVERRLRLKERISHGIIILPGNDLLAMNYRANTYPFRQDGSFSYFAGICRPDLCLIMDVESGDDWLVGASATMNDLIWSGPAPDLPELAAAAGISGIMDWKVGALFCQQALNAQRKVHYLPRYQGDQSLKLSTLLAVHPAVVEFGFSAELIRAVVGLRSCKSAEEVEEICAAIGISADMYRLLMTTCQPGCVEMNIYGHLQGFVLSRGSQEAFPTILSQRGEVLHNHSHDLVLRDGELLLVDSGVLSPRGYASDITRTIPVNGHFSTKQKEIYVLVLKALECGTAAMAPGVPFRDCHLKAAAVVAQGLIELGLMHGDPCEAVAAGAHALFFPHGLGHMLGLDVHDMESLGEDHVGYDQEYTRSEQFGLSGLRLGRRLEQGFVVTVEPGIYFIPELIAKWRKERKLEQFINFDALEGYSGFGGIRIEDDVLVTESGHEVLSVQIPKTIAALEAAMAKS